jgi:hypothetical protein
MGNSGVSQEGPDDVYERRPVWPIKPRASSWPTPDLAVDHRLPKRSLSGFVAGFYEQDLQKHPWCLLVFEQFAADAHRPGPSRCLS